MFVFLQCLLLLLTSPTGSSLESVIYIYLLILWKFFCPHTWRQRWGDLGHGVFAFSDVLHLPSQGRRTSKVWRCWKKGILLCGKKLALRKMVLLFLASATIGNNKTSLKPWTCCIWGLVVFKKQNFQLQFLFCTLGSEKDLIVTSGATAWKLGAEWTLPATPPCLW